MKKMMCKVFKREYAFKLKDDFGIEWVGTEPNYNVPRFRVFLFEDTLEFKKAFSEINR